MHQTENISLRPTILNLIACASSEEELNAFIRLVHALAIIALRNRLSSARLHRELTGLTLNDLAYDAIADLFQRDNDGAFLQLRAYFGGMDVVRLPEQELLIHLRRLVFSKAQHAVFRFYNEYDPSLGKIIRNIKRTITVLNNFEEAERFGEIHLTPVCCEPLSHLPYIEGEQLERDLRSTRTRSENIPDLLSCLSRYLREQEEYARSVPLTLTAIIFRTLLAEPPNESIDNNAAEQRMLKADILKIIRSSCRETCEKCSPKYVGNGKVPSIVFESYFEVIEDNLAAVLVDQDGDHFPFFERLQQRIPDLTPEEYKREHKNRLEYLARLTEKYAREQLKRELR